MPDSTRKAEFALLLCFLAMICAVPVAQTCLEMKRGERVQFTDAFRYRPTAKHLRQFEKTLEEKSWFQQQFRPLVQAFLFAALGDTGAQAMMGRDGWLFYRPDVRYLIEPDRVELGESNSSWLQPSDGRTQRGSVVKAIVRFRDQLRERGIALLVVPIPGKPSVYPDQLTTRAASRLRDFRSPTWPLFGELRRHGIETVDLFAAFREIRQTAGENRPCELYLARDTHWTPTGAKCAAQAVARCLKRLGWAPRETTEFKTNQVAVHRMGDIVDMMRIPALRKKLEPERVECEQVIDPALGLLVPPSSARPGTYQYPAQKSSVLLLGDSFCRIYQFPEPQSLGERADRPGATGPGKKAEPTKRLIPGSAGFLSHLARALKAPVDAIVSDGGASTDVRQKLSVNAEILEGKKVVVWAFVERDIPLGRKGWEDVPLPPRLD